jgi:hypothetical protein
MKKRNSNNQKSNIRKPKSNNKIFVIITIIILIIVLLLIGIKLTGQVTGQIIGQMTGDATSTAIYNCSDSDKGINYFEKGLCEDGKSQYEDQCYGERGLWEYYCSKDNYVCIRQETSCPYGCVDGRCLKKGESNSINNPTVVSTETNTPPENNPIETNINNVVDGEKYYSSKELNKLFYLNLISITLDVIIFVFVGWLIFIKKVLRFRRSPMNLSWK